MAEKYGKVLQKHCKLQCTGKNWELPGAWDELDAGAVCARVALEMAIELPDGENPIGQSEKAVALRVAIRDELAPIFKAGAPINFRRTALVAMGIAPKMPEKQAEKATGKVV